MPECALFIFIFIASNIGGSLTPLGDPPLLLGFLNGVSFLSTLQHLLPETLFMLTALLALFYRLGHSWYRCAGVLPRDLTPDTPHFGLDGAINLVPLAAVIGLVLMSATWKPDLSWPMLGTEVEAQNLLRDLLLVMMTTVSLWITPCAVRQTHPFDWGPMQEVAKLFIGIFITMLPVLAMLKAGEQGAFGAVAAAVTTPDGQPLPWAYFWFAGVLLSFLDNAATFLDFSNLAGGDPAQWMGPLATTLAAISAGSVFMAANRHSGNAPNFMVKAIVEDRGLNMPGFVGDMAWSTVVLLPLFVVVTFI